MSTDTQHDEAVDFHDLDHFVDLALRGRNSGASSGELRARRLATFVLDNVPSLDDLAIDGLIKFIRGAKGCPETFRDLVDAW